ncbi:MAG: hypothetical protein U0R78_06805 [Nocardioidaceae bacterium]
MCILYSVFYPTSEVRVACAAHDANFTEPITLATVGRNGTEFHLGVDAQGSWVAAWHQRDPQGVGRIAVSRRTDGVWGPARFVTNPRWRVRDFDLAASSQGTFMFAWVASPASNPAAEARLWTRSLVSDSWGDPVKASRPGARWPRLAASPEGSFDLAWFSHRHGERRIGYRHYGPLGWGPERTITRFQQGESASGPQIASGGHDTCVVTYYRWGKRADPRGLNTTVRHNGRWQPAQVVTPARGYSDPPALLVTQSGTVWQIWYWKRRDWQIAEFWTVEARSYRPSQGWSALLKLTGPTTSDWNPLTAILESPERPAVNWITDAGQAAYSESS